MWLWVASSHNPGWKRQQSDQKQPVWSFFTTKKPKYKNPTAPNTLDATAARAAGASSSSAPMKAMPSRTDVMAKLRDVMEELHLGRGFLHPGAVLPTDNVWEKFTDKEVSSTLAFFRQELRLEKKQWGSRLLPVQTSFPRV